MLRGAKLREAKKCTGSRVLYLRYSEMDKEETSPQLGPTATRGVLGTIYENRVE